MSYDLSFYLFLFQLAIIPFISISYMLEACYPLGRCDLEQCDIMLTMPRVIDEWLYW